MINSVTFDLGAAGSLSVTQTGSNAATLNEGGNSYSLGDIIVGSDILNFEFLGIFDADEANGSVTWEHDVLTLTITKCWLPREDGVKTYQLSAQDMANWLAFLKVAAFPSN